MQPVSNAFLAEIQTSHRVHSYVEIVSDTGEVFQALCIGGSVTADKTAQVRRFCSIDIVDPYGTLTPQNAKSVLTPYGSLMRAYRGVKYMSGPMAGTTETALLGVFRISNVTVTSKGDGSGGITVQGYDLSRTVARLAFQDVYTIPVGYNLVQAIKDIINARVDDVVYDAFTSSLTASAAIVFDTSTDPWSACQSLATSAGCEVYFKANGNVKIAPPVDVDHLPSPVFTYIEGQTSNMIEVDRVFDDSSPGYNGVILVGESAGDGTTAPVRSVQWDTNTNSPTYYKGPYGQVPLFITDSTVATQAQADTAAKAQLQLVLGFLDQIAINALVNPALEPDDVIQIQRASIGVNSSYGISAINIPFSYNDMSGITLMQKRTGS